MTRGHPSTAVCDVVYEVFTGALYQVKDFFGYSSFAVNVFSLIKEEGTLPNSVWEACMTLIPKPRT